MLGKKMSSSKNVVSSINNCHQSVLNDTFLKELVSQRLGTMFNYSGNYKPRPQK